MSYRLVLSPHGRLYVEETARSEGADSGLSAPGAAGFDDAVVKAFVESSARGLLALAARRADAASWPPELLFWRDFADAFLTALAHTPDSPDGQVAAGGPMPDGLGFDLTMRIPAMRGAECATRRFHLEWCSKSFLLANLRGGPRLATVSASRSRKDRLEFPKITL